MTVRANEKPWMTKEVWAKVKRAQDEEDFKNNFISWIKLLYSAPQASVRTNNVQSEYFRLYRSTRQGCPLSPLLFAIAIEPLSIALRSNPPYYRHI